MTDIESTIYEWQARRVSLAHGAPPPSRVESTKPDDSSKTSAAVSRSGQSRLLSALSDAEDPELTAYMANPR